MLDDNGDRATMDYDIWGFGFDETGEPSIINYGQYDFESGVLTWEFDPWS